MPSGTVGQQIPEVQVPAPIVPASVVQVNSVDFMDCLPNLQNDSSAFITEMPKLPAGTVIVPQDSQVSKWTTCSRNLQAQCDL
jgi:hypothetical protein